MTAVSEGVNRLKHWRSNRSDRDSAKLQSVPLSPHPATVVVESRESRRDRAHTPPEDAVQDQMRYYGLLPCRYRIVCESRTGTVVMHFVRFSCLPIATLFPRRFCRFRSRTNTIRYSLTPVCFAAVLDAANAAVYFLVEFECRCYNRLGLSGPRDAVESWIKTAFYRDIGY